MHSEPADTLPDSAPVNVQPTLDDLERQEAGTLEEHWRKGIPTAILLLFAFCVSAYYLVLIRPRIQQRYSNVVTTNWNRLGIEQIDAPGEKDTKANLVDEDANKRLAILKDTQLSLRRMVGWNPTDDTNHYRYGIVSNLLSQYYAQAATSISSTEDGGLASHYLGLTKTEYQNATGAMERVRRLGGALAPNASLWLVKSKMESNYDLSADELLKMENAVRDLLANKPDISSAKYTLSQILIERSLRHSSGLSVAERMKRLAEVEQLLVSNDNSDSQVIGLLSEASSVRNVAVGQELANKSLQSFWALTDTDSKSIESLATAFRSLLIIGSLKEAQVLLSEQLRQIPANEQANFRAVASAAALKHLVGLVLREKSIQMSGSNKSGGDSKSSIDITSFQVVFALAIQLNPESRELLTLLQSIATQDNVDPILSKIKEVALAEPVLIGSPKKTPTPEMGIRPLVTAAMALGQGDISEATVAALAGAIKLSPAFGVSASRLALQMANSDQITPDVAIRWLTAINTASPDILVAWSDRASLHLKSKQPVEAIQCLEFLLEKLPDNAQVLEALEAAKAQSKVGE